MEHEHRDESEQLPEEGPGEQAVDEAGGSGTRDQAEEQAGGADRDSESGASTGGSDAG